MRTDGRKLNELREVIITPNYTDYPEGSVLISFGKTKILCNATILDEVPRWIITQGKEHGWITAEYAMLPRSTQQRSPRETLKPRGRTMEISRLIGRSLRAAVNLKKLGRRTCILDCDVIQADGGTRTAAITGGYIALALALNKLAADGQIPNNTLHTEIAAVSTGVYHGSAMLDLCYEEDSQADVDANIVMDGKGNFIEVQCTSEGKPFSRNTLDDLLNLANGGISELITIQRTFINNFHQTFP